MKLTKTTISKAIFNTWFTVKKFPRIKVQLIYEMGTEITGKGKVRKVKRKRQMEKFLRLHPIWFRGYCWTERTTEKKGMYISLGVHGDLQTKHHPQHNQVTTALFSSRTRTSHQIKYLYHANVTKTVNGNESKQ